MRTIIKTFIFAPAIVFAAACSKDKAPDPALANDLTLAAQARQAVTLDSISAVERANAQRAAAPTGRVSTHAATTSNHAATTSSQHRASSGGTANTDGGATTEHTVTEKNTNRDAAIGAAAGAIIGGASTHSVKGGVIGAAAGAILGGVVGNNVDIHKKKIP